MSDKVSFLSNSAVLTSFENLCRICSKKFEKEKLTNLFSKNDNSLEKVTTCLPVAIHQGDNLPHNACEDCLKMVDSSFELINRAQSSEKYFFSIIETLEGTDGKIKNDTFDIPENKSEQPPQQNTKKQQLSLDLDGTYMCDICGDLLQEASALDKHIQEKHFYQSVPPNTEFAIHKICSLCGQLFDSDEAYVLHKCESRHRCPHCKKVMTTKCLLNRHIQHSCKPLYYCPNCHKTFSSKGLFMKHLEMYSEQTLQNDCVACDKKNQGSSDLPEHTCDQVVRGKSFKNHRCYICGRGYNHRKNLAKHCLQHEPKTKWQFKCQVCGNMFEKEKLLHIHYEKVHKMPKTWICRVCGKTLSTKLSLQVHERIHTKSKPFVCEWCGKAFRSKANLCQHNVRHTGIRRHKCDICGKMFSRTFFLKVHLRVHTGERPFQCDICDQRFTQVGDMRRHRKRHEQGSKRSAVIIVKRKAPSPEPSSVVFQSVIEDNKSIKLESVTT